MPMLTLPAELGAPAGPDRVPENLGREPGGAVTTADPGWRIACACRLDRR